jgi:NAD(P)-dependent dehydrogenase (short-subunit alcohol dehydrogenase family)
MGVVMITGASGGLGTHLCQAVAAAGQTVVAVAREAGRLARLGSGVQTVAADVSTEEGADAAVAGAERIGPLEGLVCAAGGFQGGAVEATTLAVWEQMMATNARSAFLATRAAMRVMAPRRSGRIVLVASLAALEGAAGAAAYAASKAAVVALMRSLAASGRADGVTANAVAPGTIDTPSNRAAMPDADRARWARPEEIAATVAFLLSDAASGISGSVLLLPGH